MSTKSDRKKKNYEEKKHIVVQVRKIPHFTVEMVSPLLTKGVTRVPLTTNEGLLMFSDKDGGTATLVDETSNEPLITMKAYISDEMRKAKCSCPDCKSKASWKTLVTGHECDHDNPYIAPVRLYAELCNGTDCTEQHVWVIGICVECEAPIEVCQLL